jgi:hypothetical protein
VGRPGVGAVDRPAVDRPAVAAGTVAGLTARWIVGGRITARGAGGLASLVALNVNRTFDR